MELRHSDFAERARKLREFGANIPKLVTKEMHGFADEIEREIKSRILKQRLDVPPLSVAYKHRKQVEGWAGGTLIRTGEYVRGIRSQESGGKVRVGPTGKDPITGVSYAKIARFLEHGTRTMPARPHWGPLRKWAVELLRKRIAAAVKKARKKA